MIRPLSRLRLGGPQAISAVVIVWSAALICTAGATHAMREAWESGDNVRYLLRQPLPDFVIDTQPLSKADYQAVVDALHATPGVVVEPGESGITIKAPQIVDYENWRLTVDEVLLSDQAYRWQVKALCAGDCPTVSYSVSLKAANQKVVLKN